MNNGLWTIGEILLPRAFTGDKRFTTALRPSPDLHYPQLLTSCYDGKIEKYICSFSVFVFVIFSQVFSSNSLLLNQL